MTPQDKASNHLFAVGYMTDWFVDNQIKLALIAGLACVLLVFLLDNRGVFALLSLGGAVIFIASGHFLFERETSENWLSISYGALLKNVVGCVLMGLGWMIFLRSVVAPAIAAILLRMG